MASTPRDETAFSLDTFTGAPAATGAQLAAANEAMRQLDETGDEAAYHEALGVEAPATKSNSGDEAPTEAPESEPSEPTEP